VQKVLIIRLSSLGDIIQCLPSVDLIKASWPHCTIHWLVRSDFYECLQDSKNIDKIISYDKATGLLGYIQLIWGLRREKYTHIYDAHSNVRSHVAQLLLFTFWPKTNFIRRSKERLKRFLLFQFKINLFPSPYKAAWSYISPLKKWSLALKEDDFLKPSVEFKDSNKIQSILNLSKSKKCIVMAPSAAWEMKRWPEEYWTQLVSQIHTYHFFIVGGPKDKMGEQIAKANPENSTDLSGLLSWQETFHIINRCDLTVSADTGVLHMSDYLQKNTIGIIGPTAFGYTSGKNSYILESPLNCRPCTKDGRGKCSNQIYKKCLMDITPQKVHDMINKLI
jgi:ADP-heptose:LPS heptosyltransferase